MARTEPRVILICLGNPGPDRAGTRHNAGYQFGEYVRSHEQFGPFEPVDGVDCTAAAGSLGGVPALLVKPNTSLNDCGAIMPALMQRYGADDHLYGMAHDDLDVPLGSVRGRAKGGHGGHNGVRSILQAAGRRDLFRIKIGIGSDRRADYDGIVDFLLSDFGPDEREKLEASFAEARNILLGQVKSYAAASVQADRREEAVRVYVERVLERAREVLSDRPAVSPFPVMLRRQELDKAKDIAVALAKLLRKARRAAAEDPALYAYLTAFIHRRGPGQAPAQGTPRGGGGPRSVCIPDGVHTRGAASPVAGRAGRALRILRG